MNLERDELQREIEDTMAELDELEAEVLVLFDQLLGEDTAGRVAAYIEAQKRQPRVAPLLRDRSSVGQELGPLDDERPAVVGDAQDERPSGDGEHAV